MHRYIPQDFREQSDIFDQVAGGYATHTREGVNKIFVQSEGRVVFGYRETKDEREAAEMELKVGVQDGTQKKKWWQRS